ncbi:MAG: helix-turn-helix domain-containing protein [Carboxylicivirga sp.]|jgi:phage repressor protein C with HTH and peptisase S24 domain|nr:helix-turn-helix domain-containing protein [Carboxylicivirga sp.]
MKTFFDKGKILERVKTAMSFNTDKELAEFLGIGKSTLSNWLKRDSLDFELVFSKCEHINADWLLTGIGDMLKVNKNVVSEPPMEAYDATVKKNEAVVAEGVPLVEGVPFVEKLAAAGFGNGEFAIDKQDVKDYYVIPKFKNRKVDFMIEVCGSSMYPKYNSGDVVACRIIKESTFIQWNKVHVLATKEQGILIKRLKKSKIKECLLAVSDNKDYEPFDIPESEITGIAIVVGVIRLE